MARTRDAATAVIEVTPEAVRERMIRTGGACSTASDYVRAVVDVARWLWPDIEDDAEAERLGREVDKVADATLSVGW